MLAAAFFGTFIFENGALAFSLECRSAPHPADKATCENGELAALDEQIATTLDNAVAHAADGHRLRERQKRWIATRCAWTDATPTASEEARGRRRDCLEYSGRTRLEVLQAIPASDRTDRLSRLCPAMEAAIRDGATSHESIERSLVQPHGPLWLDFNDDRGLSEEEGARLPLNEEAREALEEYPGGVRRKELGSGSPLFAIEAVIGTAYCRHLWFFEKLTDGSVRGLKGPHGRTAALGCGADQAWVGTSGDVPVIVNTGNSTRSSNIMVHVRENESWHLSCALEATYTLGFNIVEEHCSGPVCNDLRSLVVKWVLEVMDKGSGMPLSATSSQDVAIHLAAVSPRFRARLPMLGQEPGAETRYWPFVAFSADSAFFRAVVSGVDYLVRIGRADFYSQTSDDAYLIGVFTEPDGKVEPVAGFVIKEHRAGLERLDRW